MSWEFMHAQEGVIKCATTSGEDPSETFLGKFSVVHQFLHVVVGVRDTHTGHLLSRVFPFCWAHCVCGSAPMVLRREAVEENVS